MIRHKEHKNLMQNGMKRIKQQQKYYTETIITIHISGIGLKLIFNTDALTTCTMIHNNK